MQVDVLLGLQWGDEGKGKIVDVLCPKYDLIARFQGGPNAGHTLEFDNKKFVLNTIPSGIFNPDTLNLIGNGVVIDPIILKRELDNLKANGFDPVGTGKLVIARKAHLILPTHQLLDAASESKMGAGKIGSTLKGIGPTYMDKTGRNGLRVGDTTLPDFTERYEKLKEKHLSILSHYGEIPDFSEKEAAFLAAIEFLKSIPHVDSEHLVNQYLKEGKKVLAEGAQGNVLDTFEKIYACTHYKYDGEIIDYMPYDINSIKPEPVLEEIEGWNQDLTGITKEEEIPAALRNYISYLEKALETPITFLSVGPDRKQTLELSK